MAAWGNALGGFRRQRRDRKGRFTSSGKAARATYKAAKKRNAANHRARVRGSVKARGREIARPGSRRARNLVGGAVAYGVGRSIGSQRIQSTGAAMVRHGVSANYGRVNATRKMSKGLQRSQNRTAKRRYQKAIGSTRTTRAARNGIVIATTAGLAYGAYKTGHVRTGKTPKGSYYLSAVAKRRGIRVGGAAGLDTGARVFAEYFPNRGSSKFAGINANNKGGVLVYTHRKRKVLR